MPHSNVVFGYGLSEVGMATLFNPNTDLHLIESKVGSCGKPGTGYEITVMDIVSKTILGPNQKEELYVKSPGIIKGYYKRDTPPVDDNGYLRTGDVGFYDEDGCFFVVERLKEMFKYMAWHVVPSSVEAILLEHSAVKEAVVFGIPQSEDVGELPAAGVVLKENCQVSAEELKTFVSERVADYEKLRGGIIFVESLIRTPSGKLMRRDTKESILKSI